MFKISPERFLTIGFVLMIIVCLHYFLSEKTLNEKRRNLPSRNITIWSNDFHISPIHDVKNQLRVFNVTFIDKSLSGHCRLTNSCATDLKVLNQGNGISLSLQTRKEFYEVYRNDSEINRVNAFICFHPVSMCELFMPFNRSLIVISSTRYELGRHSPDQWTTWNNNLKLIASNSRNVIGANNLYDVEYIRYFTGIKALLLPSLCLYTHTSYSPSSGKVFLIAPIHGSSFIREFMSMLNDSSKRLNISVSVGHLREVYRRNYKYDELSQHPGIIYVPYQVSVMSLFEQYRMNIPLFFPSLDLLTEWHLKYHVVSERTWAAVEGKFLRSSQIPGVLSSDIPDPNNDLDRDAIRYWLKFSDFYQWPHIIHYNSTDDLLRKLKTTDLIQTSENMKIYNKNVTQYLHHQWNEILQRISTQ